jgi:hypothetical protein
VRELPKGRISGSKVRLRRALAGGLLVAAALAAHAFLGAVRALDADAAPPRPLPFNHKHHVGEMGIDCRYCHTAVEVGPAAGMPPLETCLTCHAPVPPVHLRERPTRFRAVLALPGHAYFDHGIHVQKGVACTTCHGRLDRMVEFRQVQRFTMNWCLECHRDPAPHLVRPEQVFAPAAAPPPAADLQERLLQLYAIDRQRDLTHCYICHR